MNPLLQLFAKYGSEETKKFVVRYSERSELLRVQNQALDDFQSKYPTAMKSNDPQFIKQVLISGKTASGTYHKEVRISMLQLTTKLEQLENSKPKDVLKF